MTDDEARAELLRCARGALRVLRAMVRHRERALAATSTVLLGGTPTDCVICGELLASVRSRAGHACLSCRSALAGGGVRCVASVWAALTPAQRDSSADRVYAAIALAVHDCTPLG